MAYSFTINGTERGTDVLNQTITIDDILNEQVNTCSFSLIDHSGHGIPQTDDEVIITLSDGTVIFAGNIVSVSLSKKELGVVKAQIQCADYTSLLDSHLVHKSYQNMTDAAIIEDIVDTYCAGSGITTNNVTTGATITSIHFNYVQPSQAFRKLAQLTGRNWYIDYQKDIHYFPLTTNAAPFSISDAANLNKVDNVSIAKDATQMKNRIYVRGGTKLSDATQYKVKGDGSMIRFVLPDKPHNVSVSVNGVSKTLGIKNVDLSGFQYYLNFEEKYLEQDSSETILTTSDELTVTYQYDIPILVAQEDTASIAANGVKEFAIFDKTLDTTEAARNRAIAELTDYADDLISGKFTTWQAGFRSGQYVTINIAGFGVNDQYLIKRVRVTTKGAEQFFYEVELASVRTMGIIRFLIEMLEANRNLIELDDDEVIDELFSLSDSLNADSLLDSLIIDSAGAYATWSSGSETTPATRARYDLFQWG